jgi:hypothetical protein
MNDGMLLKQAQTARAVHIPPTLTITFPFELDPILRKQVISHDQTLI